MIEKCIDDSPLQGACCTNQCQYYNTCQANRTPLLIHAVIIDRKTRQMFVDAYINEIVFRVG